MKVRSSKFGWPGPDPNARRYNRGVTTGPLSLDTSAEVERLQVEGWRRMSSAQKAAMVTALTSAALDMARAGVRHRHPDESVHAQRLRLAVVMLGPDLARQAFPDLDDVP